MSLRFWILICWKMCRRTNSRASSDLQLRHLTVGLYIIIYSCELVWIKRYFIIDKHIAWHFVHYSECLYPSPFHATQIVNIFLASRISANLKKGWNFSQSGNPYTPYCSSSVEPFLWIIQYIQRKKIVKYFVSHLSVKWAILLLDNMFTLFNTLFL